LTHSFLFTSRQQSNGKSAFKNFSSGATNGPIKSLLLAAFIGQEQIRQYGRFQASARQILTPSSEPDDLVPSAIHKKNKKMKKKRKKKKRKKNQKRARTMGQ
jgi:hypothetical protein